MKKDVVIKFNNESVKVDYYINDVLVGTGWGMLQLSLRTIKETLEKYEKNLRDK